MTDHLEIERKFDVDPGFTVPDLSGLPGIASVDGPTIYQLVAIYYDTADLRLAARKVTLRRRTGGTDAGWHLKLPADQPGARLELHEPVSDELPARLAAHIAGITAGAAVAPIATLSTQRTVHILRSPSGSVAAEVADDAVTAQRNGTGEPPLSWREVEVEAGDEGTGILAATATLLLRAGARPSGSGSKLARLLTG
jgi:inorganic triphosphatase YgiF